MKNIYLIIILFISNLASFSQTISPTENNEFCPNVEYLFTVTLPSGSSNPFLSATNNASITVQPAVGSTTNFTFKAKFFDDNATQSFILNWSPNGSKTFSFNKIKSLRNYSSYSKISANPFSITAQRCQIQSFNISFNNVQYGNGITNVGGYGNVSTYQYLLPVGWKLGNTTSTGAWMAGGNNVTVTSDLATGDGSYIQVRPTNTECGLTLKEGPPTLIGISRPEPTLTITPTGAS